MKKSMLYTRTGDAGMTSLAGGSRIAKNSARVCAYGDVDELNSHLGLVQAYAASIRGARQEAQRLSDIQQLMFVIGAYLASPDALECQGLGSEHTSGLEAAIDSMDASLPPLKSFILPGGSIAASAAHIARTVCRRAERSVLALAAVESVDPDVTAFLNRLSDYLFILSRKFNALTGIDDTMAQ